MQIEFHCEHCNFLIRAPSETGGRKGKCPHCQGVCYVPMPEGMVEEIPLAPLDEAAERNRESSHREDVALHLRLMQEQSMPDERRPGQGMGTRGAAGTPSSPRPPAAPRAELKSEDIERLVVGYVNAMSDGHLEQADRLATQMGQHRDKVLSFIDTIASDELAAARLPTLPRPVLLGFLKQLRGRM